MRWVTPLLLVGTAEEAAHRGEPFTEDAGEAIAKIKVRQPVVVSSKEVAADCIRHFGASEDWIDRHVMTDWADFTGFDPVP